MSAEVAATKKRSDLGLRTVTGLILIAIALGSIVYGQTPFWVLVSIAALIICAEWSSLIAAARWHMWLALTGVALAMLLLEPHIELSALAGFEGLVVAALAVGVLTRNGRMAVGMLYAGLPSVALCYIHGEYDGTDLTLWTMAIVWATDIGAYFAGRSIGGPKLAPAWSPNKTWSGLIGGVVCAIVVGLSLTMVIHVQLRLAALAGMLAVAAQGGDLFESQMKRQAGVKDSGHILPGHGGVMDRLDGLVPVVCIVAAILVSGVL